MEVRVGVKVAGVVEIELGDEVGENVGESVEGLDGCKVGE